MVEVQEQQVKVVGTGYRKAVDDNEEGAKAHTAAGDHSNE